MITYGQNYVDTIISPILVSETFIFYIFLKLSKLPKYISDYFLVELFKVFFCFFFFPFRETDVLEITAASIQHSFFSSDSCGDAQSSLDKRVPQWKRREKLESFIFQIPLKSPD